MNKINQDAKTLMEQGWKASENLDFKTAEDLLHQAKLIFEKDGDWFNVTECLNHLAYNEKLRSSQLVNHGIELANQALSISKTHKTKDTLILRALTSLLESQGNYEGALKHARKLLETTDKPANKADILSFIAKSELRTGNIKEAKASIEKAEQLLEEGWESEREPHRSIWKSGILMTKALILFNLGDTEGAIKSAELALSIAKKGNLKSRVTQSESLLETIKRS